MSGGIFIMLAASLGLTLLGTVSSHAQDINDDAPQNGAGYYITASFSEENGGAAYCPNGYAVKGIECRGAYCDNKRLYCWPLGPLRRGTLAYTWHEWFSDENYSNAKPLLENYHVGTTFKPVTGMQCSGGYCDNIRLEKVTVYGAAVSIDQCQQTPFFSDEIRAYSGVGNTYVCPWADRYVAGVTCQGGYCDNISLYCCRMY